MDKRPPKRIDFSLIRVKNGGYLLKWSFGIFQAVFGTPYRQAFSSYDEAMKAINAISGALG